MCARVVMCTLGIVVQRHVILKIKKSNTHTVPLVSMDLLRRIKEGAQGRGGVDEMGLILPKSRLRQKTYMN